MPVSLLSGMPDFGADTPQIRNVASPGPRVAQLSLRRRLEFILDALLLVLSLLLFAPRLTGLPLHEWIGIGIAIPVIVHILLSWRWIGASSRRFIARPTPRLRLNYSINAVLFVAFVVVIGSGIVISQAAVPSLGFKTIDDRTWRLLHNQSTDFLLVGTAWHLAMNWSWVMRTAQRAMWRGPWTTGRIQAIGLLRSIARSVVVLIVAAVVIGITFRYVGRPNADRRYARNEFTKFAGSPFRGLGQFAGEAFLVLAVGYTGRKLLRLRI